MNNGQINQGFLAATDLKTRASILGEVAARFGISEEQAFAELTSDRAEHLLDYLTEPIRGAVSILMQRHSVNA